NALAILRERQKESGARAEEKAVDTDDGQWTPGEIAQLKALLKAPPDPRTTKAKAAYVVLLHKRQSNVHVMMDSIKRENVRLKHEVDPPIVWEKMLENGPQAWWSL
ncbi:hypothetical protein IW140_003853, partial [Coemansia sp. RSA 1813]